MRRYPLLIILAVVEVIILVIAFPVAMAENCNQGSVPEPRWECNESLGPALAIAFWGVVPLLALFYVWPDFWPWLTSAVGRVGRWVVVGLVLAFAARVIDEDNGSTHQWQTLPVLWAFMAAALVLLVVRLVERSRRRSDDRTYASAHPEDPRVSR